MCIAPKINFGQINTAVTHFHLPGHLPKIDQLSGCAKIRCQNWIPGLMLLMAIRIGCGSWADAEYMGLLYPPAFPPDLRLCGYAMWFDHVEVNATYYALPKKKTVEKWIEQTPSGFLFDIRVPRTISQSPAKAGKDGRLIDIMLKNLEPLREAKRLGVFLLVLSPFFKPERHHLEELDDLIKKMRPHSLAVELRHSDWVSKKLRASTLRYFKERKLTFVTVDMPPIKGSDLMPFLEDVTQPGLAYVRLHGRNPGYVKAKSAMERHTYLYPENELKELVQRIRRLSSKAKEVRVVANNHAQDFAPRTALALKEMLGQSLT
jgi:uncharacterized protein YecE (DUF72 family)